MELGKLISVSAVELQEILTSAKADGRTELAIIDADSWLPDNPNDWPADVKGHLVYRLHEPIIDFRERLAGIRTLQKLVVLDVALSDHDLIFLAAHLTELTSLSLWSNNSSDAGARAIAENFRQLTSLYLRNNKIGEAGARAIAENLHQLSSLDLRFNHIGEAGAHAIAENLRQLTSLALGDNQIGDPAARAIAENLRQLTSLDLMDNKIGEAGARAIAENLCQLTSLDLNFNEIGDPAARAIAENLRQLTSLDLFHSEIGMVGALAIAEKLRQLTSLGLGSGKFGDAGARVIAENLHQLTSLDLSFNQIGESGARSIAENLRQITTLNLAANQIGDAGARTIAENLHQLTSLNLSANQIGDGGARAIAENLHQLTSLNLGANQIGDAGARAVFDSLHDSLRSLELDDNLVCDSGIRAISERLTQMTTLNLKGNNGIKDASAFSRLSSLRSLDLSKTSVTDLSSLKDLVLRGMPVRADRPAYERQGIYVQDCPLVHPSVEIVAQGPEAVLNYFREIESQGADRLYEAKVLILGDGSAGKTSLLRRLYRPDLPLPNEDETTKGIDIHRQHFQTPQGREFRLNVWDFGGQQIYHATHQFFLTKNSLYILVDDTRKNDNSIHDESFKYWLGVVEVLSDGSPLLIFQNEKGGRSKTIDEAGIKGRFPNVKERYQGNLENAHSADAIRTGIEYFAQQLPHIGEEVPKKWVAVRQAIEERAAQAPFISQDEYFEIYGRRLQFDRTKALHLSRYLHDLGVFLHFQDDPLLRRTVILQNKWATDAVFKILDDEIVKQRFGRFTQEDCERLWADSQYADMHPELLGMMVKFELCYPLADITPTNWLAPQLMSPSKPESLQNWKSPSDLVISFRYAFLPKGLVNRLMVRMHRFVKRIDLSWAHGVLFEQQETQVLVEATSCGNEIELRARGPESKALLSVIASALEGLNATFKGLEGKVGQWIPCICEQCAQDSSPEMFEQAELLRRKRLGKQTIECRKSFENVSVLGLLDGLKPEHLPAWAKELRTIHIFLASSAELREDRDALHLYIAQLNDRLRNEGLYLQVDRWENSLDAMSETRLQDEYNKNVRACDIFLSLFKTKAGKFTQEEFDVAFQTFQETGKPFIYTFFHDAQVSISSIDEADFASLKAFQKQLSGLGHFYTSYNNIEHLKLRFRDQLDKLGDAGRI